MNQYEIELRDKVALAVMLSPEPMYDLHGLTHEQVIKYAFNIAYKFMDERKQWGGSMTKAERLAQLIEERDELLAEDEELKE